jgi:hypothetical protein
MRGSTDLFDVEGFNLDHVCGRKGVVEIWCLLALNSTFRFGAPLRTFLCVDGIEVYVLQRAWTPRMSEYSCRSTCVSR